MVHCPSTYSLPLLISFPTIFHIILHPFPHVFQCFSNVFPMFSQCFPHVFPTPVAHRCLPHRGLLGPNQGLLMAAADDSSEAAAGAELWRLVPRLERRRRAKKAPVACGVAPPKTVRKWAQNRWQWFGLVGKIYTGNPWVFTMRYGGFRFQFSLKPIH